jgi:predicted RNA-binding Zn ribbon-like protein
MVTRNLPDGDRRKLLWVVTKRATQLRLVGGDPALDLANTLEGPDAPETLVDYEELTAWAARAGVIDRPTAKRLAAGAHERPADGARVLTEARDLRTTVDAVFRAVAIGDEPPEGALAQLVDRGAAAVARARLRPSRDGFVFAWEGDDLERPLWPLAAAAVDLLRAGPLDRLKVCDVCPWLFIDTSRNRSRRWCSMSECGGRLKMKRYRERRAMAGR